jgi:uncharacterized phosphosugar-binding protein
MLMDQYFEELKKVLIKIETTQREPLQKAAKMIADALVNGGLWHILDTGHMLMYEGVGRTGGMMALRPIRITCEVDNPTRTRNVPGKPKVYYTQVEGFAEFVLKRANVEAGDVLMIGSVSGYEAFPVQAAQAAKEMGVHTLAITAVAYSSRLTSKHPSGKRLFEMCDMALDNCAPMGDALVNVDALGIPVGPASGIGAAYVLWALECCVMEELISRGKNPSVYISNHMPGAGKYNAQALENYEHLGY